MILINSRVEQQTGETLAEIITRYKQLIYAMQEMAGMEIGFLFTFHGVEIRVSHWSDADELVEIWTKEKTALDILGANNQCEKSSR